MQYTSPTSTKGATTDFLLRLFRALLRTYVIDGNFVLMSFVHGLTGDFTRSTGLFFDHDRRISVSLASPALYVVARKVARALCQFHQGFGNHGPEDLPSCLQNAPSVCYSATTSVMQRGRGKREPESREPPVNIFSLAGASLSAPLRYAGC